jgi:hypothetical protein
VGWKSNRSSNDKVWPMFTKDDPNEILMGYEYEIDVNVDKLYKHVERERWNYENPKQFPLGPLPERYNWGTDGMGRHIGFEIRSPVAPLVIHKRTWNKSIRPVLKFNTEPNGAKNGGGIHVSTNRSTFTEKSFNKVRVFLYNHENYPFLFKLSQRDHLEWSHWCYQPPSFQQWKRGYNWHVSEKEAKRYWETMYFNRTSNKYYIINACNEERFEFRMFAANPDLLIPALEMNNSLFEMAPQVESINIENWTNFLSGKFRFRGIKELVNKVSV